MITRELPPPVAAQQAEALRKSLERCRRLERERDRLKSALRTLADIHDAGEMVEELVRESE